MAIIRWLSLMPAKCCMASISQWQYKDLVRRFYLFDQLAYHWQPSQHRQQCLHQLQRQAYRLVVRSCCNTYVAYATPSAHDCICCLQITFFFGWLFFE